MRDYLINLISWLGQWGYVLVFTVVMLECQPLLGLLMAGETLVGANNAAEGTHA